MMITENHPRQHLGHQNMCVNTDSYNHYSNIQCHCFFNAIASDYKQKSGFFTCRCRHRARPHSCNPDPGDCKDVGAFVQGRASGTQLRWSLFGKIIGCYEKGRSTRAMRTNGQWLNCGDRCLLRGYKPCISKTGKLKVNFEM